MLSTSYTKNNLTNKIRHIFNRKYYSWNTVSVIALCITTLSITTVNIDT